MTPSEHPHRSQASWLARVGVLLAAWALLQIGLTNRSLWTDEALSLELSRGPARAVIAAAAADIHPPLYFLGLSAWTAVAGTSDFALRWFSIAAGLSAVALMAPLARAWLGRRAALPAALLLALAPAFVEFSRMARYYALVAALGLAATLGLIAALRRGGWKRWLGYAAAGAALVSTFYPAAALLAAHGLLAISWRGQPPGRSRRLAGWAAACASVVFISLVAYGPHILARMTLMGQTGGADLSRSGLGLVLGVLMTGYTFGIGETLFPWNPVAWLGLAAAVALLLASLRHARARGRLALGVLAVSVITTALITTYVSAQTPFVNVPVRALYALPFLIVALIAGWQTLSPSRLRMAAGAGLVLAWGLSLVNLYLGRQALNPIYLTPAREVAAHLAQLASPSDLLLLEPDSVVGRYLPAWPNGPRQLPAQDIAAVAEALSASPRVIWLVTLGRDQTQARSTAGEIRALLAQDYVLAATERWLPLDERYLALKNLLLGRDTYTHRLTLETYRRRTP